MAKIGIYGGSFNPVHFGHTGLAQWIVEHTDIDEVWLMVSPNNPLKPVDSLAPEQERLEQVRRAIQNMPGLVASDFEFSLPRPSYTANTLRALVAVYPEHEFTLIMGEDNWAIREQWREWEWIVENFRIMVYPRITTGQVLTTRRSSAYDTGSKHPTTTTTNVVYLGEAPLFDISSTQIRKK